MLTSIRGLAAVTFLSTAAFAAPALAQNVGPDNTPLSEPGSDTAPPSAFEVSGNVAIVSDYRFRGVSLSGGDVAVQGGIDVGHEGGFYVGTWASSIDGGPSLGEVELDLYGGWSRDVAEGIALDVGLVYYVYPSEDIGANVDYFEPYASISTTLGPASAEFGVAYAWDQDSLGSEDNLYLYTDLGVGIPNTPISLSAHLGYTDGVLARPFLAGSLDDSGFDYSVGATATVLGGIELGVAYVGVDGPSIDGFTDDTVVATVGFSF